MIPLPILNIAGITAIVVRMVRKLSKLYGVPFERSAMYGAPTPHIATIDISDLTNVPGPLHIVAHAIWTLGPGNSHTADVTIECHPNPKET